MTANVTVTATHPGTCGRTKLDKIGWGKREAGSPNLLEAAWKVWVMSRHGPCAFLSMSFEPLDFGPKSSLAGTHYPQDLKIERYGLLNMVDEVIRRRDLGY
jgi:hypothetical protein